MSKPSGRPQPWWWLFAFDAGLVGVGRPDKRNPFFTAKPPKRNTRRVHTHIPCVLTRIFIARVPAGDRGRTAREILSRGILHRKSLTGHVRARASGKAFPGPNSGRTSDVRVGKNRICRLGETPSTRRTNDLGNREYF